jgi:hypothetical protein
MTQNQLFIKYQEEKKSNKITNYAGIFPILEFIKKMGIFKFADKNLQVRSGDQGWLDSHHFLSVFLINLIGGDCMSDVDILESDEGLKTTISSIEKNIVNIKKKTIAKRFRKGRERVFPSDNALHNYALCFHNESEEQRREPFRLAKKVFIPKPMITLETRLLLCKGNSIPGGDNKLNYNNRISQNVFFAEIFSDYLKK